MVMHLEVVSNVFTIKKDLNPDLSSYAEAWTSNKKTDLDWRQIKQIHLIVVLLKYSFNQIKDWVSKNTKGEYSMC